MRDRWHAIVSAWRAGSARYYEIRCRQRRRAAMASKGNQ
jgi:hypothetical protein